MYVHRTDQCATIILTEKALRTFGTLEVYLWFEIVGTALPSLQQSAEATLEIRWSGHHSVVAVLHPTKRICALIA